MGIVMSILKTIWRQIIGRAFLGNWEENPWFVVLQIFFIAVSILWMFKLGYTDKKTGVFKSVASILGQFIGGLIIGVVTVLIGISIAMWAVHTVIGLGIGLIAGGLGAIPWVGKYIAAAFTWVATLLLGIVVPILIGIYILKNVSSLWGTIKDKVEGSAKSWEDPNGPGGVKLLYCIVGSLFAAGLINHPQWNPMPIPIFSIASTILAVVSLFVGTKAGRKKLENLKTRALKGPRESDGADQCLNFELVEKTVKVNGKTKVVKDKKGKTVMKKVHCKGPQGKDPNGVPYDGWNPKGTRYCMSPTCDHPPPYWQVCYKDEGGCGYGGEDGKGFPRKPDEPVVCIKCNKTWMPHPESTGFHPPGEDKYNASTPGAPLASAATQPVATQPVAGQPATAGFIPPLAQPGPTAGAAPWVTSSYQDTEINCSQCGTSNLYTNKACRNCGTKELHTLSLATDKKVVNRPRRQKAHEGRRDIFR